MPLRILLLTLAGCSQDNIPPAGASAGKIADHRVVNELRTGQITEAEIKLARQKLRIGYGHTSHGSQITTGMSGLTAFADGGGLGTAYEAGLFEFSPSGAGGTLSLKEGDGTAGLNGDAGYFPQWVNETQKFLDNPDHGDFNVIMWSWCGQVSGINEQDMIEQYLKPMSDFEKANPGVVFVYMTGHLDGSGEEGNLHLRNEQIRKYCRDNGKWLFDFADIESRDPDGNFYLDKAGKRRLRLTTAAATAHATRTGQENGRTDTPKAETGTAALRPTASRLTRT